MGVDGGAPRLRHSRSICEQLRSFHTRPGHQSALGSSASNEPSSLSRVGDKLPLVALVAFALVLF
jgi:hypothetical protein